MMIFVIWFLLVVNWNFRYPGTSPLEDVIIAIILAFNFILIKYLKF
jgi:hypothetical protein